MTFDTGGQGGARIGDTSKCAVHSSTGRFTEASEDVLVNGRCAVRIGDCAPCSGACQAKVLATAGANSVLINDRPVHRVGDKTLCCGAGATTASGSSNVLIGNGTPSECRPSIQQAKLKFHVVFSNGKAISNEPFQVLDSDGAQVAEGRLDSDGYGEACSPSWGAHQLVLENGWRLELFVSEDES